MPELALPVARNDAAGASSDVELSRFAREHFAAVWRFLRRLGLPEGDADDAAQQVFLIACGRWERIQAGSERAFLFGCALNHAKKWRAEQGRRRETRPLDETELAGPSDPEQLVNQLHARQTLDGLLQRLPLPQRSVFILYELEEWGTYEIAEMLGVPRGTVVSRLRVARERLEEHANRLRDAGRTKP